MKRYYDVPTQVRFFMNEDEGYCGGIAYHDEIICGCCGGVFEIEEIIDETPRGLIPIHDYNDWMDLTGVIMDKDCEITEDDYDTEQLSLFDGEDCTEDCDCVECAECPGTYHCSDCDRPTKD